MTHDGPVKPELLALAAILGDWQLERHTPNSGTGCQRSAPRSEDEINLPGRQDCGRNLCLSSSARASAAKPPVRPRIAVPLETEAACGDRDTFDVFSIMMPDDAVQGEDPSARSTTIGAPTARNLHNGTALYQMRDDLGRCVDATKEGDFNTVY